MVVEDVSHADVLFILKHQNLEKLIITGGYNRQVLVDCLESLTLLKELQFDLKSSNNGNFTHAEDTGNANRNELRVLHPLLSGVRILKLKGEGICKYRLYQDFWPKSRITIVNFD
jgi:hypothetical protein